MVLSNLAALGAICLSATCCILLVPLALERVQGLMSGALIRARIQGNESKSMFVESDGNSSFGMRERLDKVVRVMLAGGIPALSKPSNRLLVFKGLRNLCKLASEALEMRGIKTNSDAICQLYISVQVVAFTTSLLFTRSVLIALALCLVIRFSIRIKASNAIKSMNDSLIDQLPDAFRALGVYYGAGLTMIQSLEQASKEIGDPLERKLEDVCFKMKSGASIHESLGVLRDCGCEQLEFLSIILEIQQRTGGPLQPLLERAAESVSASRDLRQSLRTQTASSRLSSKIITIMPIAIFLLAGLLNPQSIVGFLTSGLGLFMFTVACTMQLIGILSVRKILGIDVG